MEGGMGIKDLHEMQKYFQIKFAYKIPTSECLWTEFFRAKYLKGGHLMTYNNKASNSQFLKSIMGCVSDVMVNVKIILRGENFNFWYDRWLSLGPLSIRGNDISNKKLRIKEGWTENEWNIDFLRDLVGEEEMEEIIQMKINGISDLDMCVWKPNLKRNLLLHLLWRPFGKK